MSSSGFVTLAARASTKLAVRPIFLHIEIALNKALTLRGLILVLFLHIYVTCNKRRLFSSNKHTTISVNHSNNRLPRSD